MTYRDSNCSLSVLICRNKSKKKAFTFQVALEEAITTIPVEVPITFVFQKTPSTWTTNQVFKAYPSCMVQNMKYIISTHLPEVTYTIMMLHVLLVMSRHEAPSWWSQQLTSVPRDGPESIMGILWQKDIIITILQDTFVLTVTLKQSQDLTPTIMAHFCTLSMVYVARSHAPHMSMVGSWHA